MVIVNHELCQTYHNVKAHTENPKHWFYFHTEITLHSDIVAKEQEAIPPINCSLLEIFFQKYKKKTAVCAEQLTSLISRCMIVFGTVSFIVLLTIVRYEATNERMLSTWRSSAGSDFATSSRVYTNTVYGLDSTRFYVQPLITIVIRLIEMCGCDWFKSRHEV